MSESREDKGGTAVVVVVNGSYARAMLSAAEVLVGPLDAGVVEAPREIAAPDVRQGIVRAIEEQSRGRPDVLLITDLCGSTPANVCLQLLARHPRWEMVSGLNMAMLMKLSTCNRSRGAAELAQQLRDTSGRSIRLGSEILEHGERRGH